MADDRTIAPTPSRWQHAWRAGLRPWSPWLLPGLAFGLLALAFDGSLEAGRAASWLGLRPGAVTPEAWLSAVAAALVTGFAVAGLLVVVVALLSQHLGVVSALDQHRLGAAPARPMLFARLVLCIAVSLGLLLALAGVLAGAARAVDASDAGLVALWLDWAERASMVLAVGLVLGALAELLLDRRDREARLWQTPQAARDEARAAGGRSQ